MKTLSTILPLIAAMALQTTVAASDAGGAPAPSNDDPLTRPIEGDGAATRYRLTMYYGHYLAGVARAGSDAAEVAWVPLPMLAGLSMTGGTAALIAEAARRLNKAGG